MTLDYIGDFAWLDELVRQVNILAQDQFVLIPLTRGRAEDPRHGRCIKCAYMMRWIVKPGFRPHLPQELAKPLNALIQNCAEEAEAELVHTHTKGKPDFADWFVRTDGWGELRIYFVDPT